MQSFGSVAWDFALIVADEEASPAAAAGKSRAAAGG
jgi:hypothetical protein